MAYAVDIRNLTKNYGKSRGITDVSFQVPEGEIFGFIGPNGAGKSTTIRTLLALIRPTSGSATVFGLDCIAKAPEIARRVGYLPSEVFYYDGMRVRDLLSYSASFYKKDCSAKMKKLADRLDLDLSKKIDDLSFGNKKKVGIVQGLLHDPDLIILDEPTSGLDPLMQQTFFALIREENARGATVLMSSHILSEVQKICGRVAIIKEGRILKIEDMKDWKRSNFKRVTLETDDRVEPILFGERNVGDFTFENGEYHFMYRGEIASLTHALNGLSLSNLTVTEPDLEEVFLHYYTKED